MSAPAAESKVYTRANDFREFIAVEGSGEVIEIDRAMFEYFLNVLPTKGEHTTVRIGLVTRFVDFLQAEGAEELTAYWIEGSGPSARYFAQRTDIMNPYA